MNLTETNVTTIINNLSVSYSDEGPVEAPVVIFIHGFPLNKSMWDLQLAELKDEYRVIAYDIRGHGDSDAGNENFSIDLFANDLISFMDILKITKAVVCGLSMGGYIVLNAIGNYPDRFDALILCDTQFAADTPEVKENRLAVIEHIRKNGLEDYAHASIKNLFAPVSLLSKETEIASVREMIVNTSKDSIYNTLHALAIREETSAILSDIKIPVLILVGKEDNITPLEIAESMHKKITGSQLNIIEHAGHLSNMENPFEFNYQIRKFISSVY
jgi:3-oxoadipate enol-lactonase